jgi:phosphatidylglycerophosphatase A
VRVLLRVYATGLWTGFFPVASGTAGALLGLALWLWAPLPLGRDGTLGVLPGLFLAALALLGVPASHRGEAEFGEDGSPIVIDEVIGMWVTVVGLVPAPVTALAGFVLFRIFDILKPFPAGRSQAWGGGWGVMADDVFAGVYAAVVLRVLLHFLPLGGP